VKPSPEYSGLQLQLKLPIVFEQIALISHPPLFVEHSLMSIFGQLFDLNISVIFYFLFLFLKKAIPSQLKPFPE